MYVNNLGSFVKLYLVFLFCFCCQISDSDSGS